MSLILISFFSFIVFNNYFVYSKAQHNHLSNRIVQSVQVVFLGTLSYDGNKVTGQLRYNDKEFNFSYFNNNKVSKLDVQDIKGKSCHIDANIKPLNHYFGNKEYMIIKKIDYKSCYYTKNMLITTLLNNHKSFVEQKLKANNIKDLKRILAIITGDTTILNQSYLDKLKEVGIYHLSAVSGTHVAILVSTINFVLNRFKIPMILIKITLIIVLIAYLLYTNFIPSATRAILAAIIVLSLPKRVVDNSMDVLGLCFITLSLVNPAYIYNVGFQFSFFITFLILFALPLLKELSFFPSLFMITFIAQLGGMVISVINFNQIQWIGLFSNLFFVPFYSFILFPCIIILFITLHFPTHFSILSSLFNNLLIFHDFVLNVFYKLNRFKWYVSDLNETTKLLVVVLVLLTVILLVHKKIKYIIVTLALLYFIFSIVPLHKENRLTMLDVGQGDAILFETDQNKNVLIDTGGNVGQVNSTYNYQIAKFKLLNTFKKRGISQLDYIILTHPHSDHIGELPYLMQTIRIKHLIIDKASFNNHQLLTLKVKCQQYNIKLIDFRSQSQLNLDDATINFLDTIIDNSGDLNEHSIITFIRVNGHTILLMGDATSNNESVFLKKYNISNIDILKVGHHGSKTSSTDAFINKTHPKVSLISAGKNNMYHLPNKEVVDKLNAIRSILFQTSESGNITLSLQNELKIHTEISK